MKAFTLNEIEEAEKNSLLTVAVKEDMFSSVQIFSFLNSQKTLVFDYGYTIKLLLTKSISSVPPGGGHLNVTWRGGAHFLRISTCNPFKKKICTLQYPVSKFLDYKTIGKQQGNNSLLFLKTIAFLFLNT